MLCYCSASLYDCNLYPTLAVKGWLGSRYIFTKVQYCLVNSTTAVVLTVLYGKKALPVLCWPVQMQLKVDSSTVPRLAKPYWYIVVMSLWTVHFY